MNFEQVPVSFHLNNKGGSVSADILILGLPHFVSALDKHNPSVIFGDIGTERRQMEIIDLVAALSKLNIGAFDESLRRH